MRTLSTTEQLAEFCAECAKFDYVTIDTEFLRERTYYSKLCLIQMAHPGEGEEGAVLVDVLEDGLDLGPLYELFQNESVTKVFHAARQDLEIFFVDRQIFPKPFFDTQVAAMVCGFGEQVGYETLVRKIAKSQLDKSSRFTDWSQRPLSDKQKTYALGDVTHLRDIYEFLSKRLEKTKRKSWVEEEVEILINPETYNTDPNNAWRRVKTRSSSRRFLATVQELAKFREIYAQDRNIPRNRVYKDDALMEVAATRPKSVNDLNKSRLLLREARKGQIAEGILTAIKAADAIANDDLPAVAKVKQRPQGSEGLADLLRVLLKAKAEEAGVAQKLIASASDLDDIAANMGGDHVFRGWRSEVFGKDAKDLCDGKVALSASGSSVKIVRI
jgi:ribonuclease D